MAVALEGQLRGTRGGAAVCVYHRGERVVDMWGGARNSDGEAWQEDTASFSFSTSKGVVATLVHVLADRGLVDYDAPVARYWPEFAQAGKGAITVRQLLSHQAGLYPIRGLVDDARRLLDWDYMTDALARARPAHEPGQHSGYHVWTFGWLAGELVQRVAGKPFSEVLESELATPLDLDGLFIGTPDAEHARVAEVLRPKRRRAASAVRNGLRQLQRGARALRLPVDLDALAAASVPPGIEQFDYNAPETLRAVIPAANGVFTARSLARLYAVLANGGEHDGVRLMSRETLDQASRVQNPRRDRLLGMRMDWRLGYHGVRTTRGTPRSAFGHWGADGSCAWADPRRKLAVAMTLNHGMITPLIHLRTARLSGAALACVARRSRG